MLKSNFIYNQANRRTVFPNLCNLSIFAMKQCLFLFIFCLGYLPAMHAQELDKDSIPQETSSKSFLKKAIIPVAFIGLGVAISGNQFEKDFQADVRNSVGNDFSTSWDDYIHAVPVAEMYLADILGVEAKNHWFDQSKNLFFSNALAYLTTTSLKKAVGKTRPNGEDYSFPSGHTTVAFTNASVLRQEFKGTSPLLAYSGYIFATGTGFLRIANNKHWLSDVLAGAGIGMLATEVIYRIEPLKNFNPFKKVKNMAFSPQLGQQGYGLYWAYRF
jgi:hypothetical protein